jgi:hypothetical protein
VITLVAAFVVVVVCAALMIRSVLRRKLHLWLPSYVARRLHPARVPDGVTIDVLFCLADHYEPGWNHVDRETERARVKGWPEKYPRLARDFADADGRPPQHTWFYPPHYYRREHFEAIVGLCRAGYGEIEMHLHHNRLKPFPDTSATLRAKILACLDTYSAFGAFDTKERGARVRRFAFIHGDWALDNSRPDVCGVNDEITILRDTGCYADFTFPAYMMDSQPGVANTIFYATDDPLRPSSHRSGVEIHVGGTAQGDLLIIQGPFGIRWARRGWCPLPKVDDGEISASNLPTPDRVDFWVRTGVHVRGRREWVVVKAFTHGADLREQEVVLGDAIRRMHEHLRRAYNDGTRYRLHYVSARELYNIVKAAEAGCAGNAGLYRDYLLEPYVYRVPPIEGEEQL